MTDYDSGFGFVSVGALRALEKDKKPVQATVFVFGTRCTKVGATELNLIKATNAKKVKSLFTGPGNVAVTNVPGKLFGDEPIPAKHAALTLSGFHTHVLDQGVIMVTADLNLSPTNSFTADIFSNASDDDYAIIMPWILSTVLITKQGPTTVNNHYPDEFGGCYIPGTVQRQVLCQAGYGNLLPRQKQMA